MTRHRPDHQYSIALMLRRLTAAEFRLFGNTPVAPLARRQTGRSTRVDWFHPDPDPRPE